jgi:hypothetical protein
MLGACHERSVQCQAEWPCNRAPKPLLLTTAVCIHHHRLMAAPEQPQHPACAPAPVSPAPAASAALPVAGAPLRRPLPGLRSLSAYICGWCVESGAGPVHRRMEHHCCKGLVPMTDDLICYQVFCIPDTFQTSQAVPRAQQLLAPEKGQCLAT